MFSNINFEQFILNIVWKQLSYGAAQVRFKNLKHIIFVHIGCGKLYVADGNWKLRYAHCMWKVPIEIEGFGKVNYPNVCPLSPKRGHAFCATHCEKAEMLGYPPKTKDFFKTCGVMDTTIEEG